MRSPSFRTAALAALLLLSTGVPLVRAQAQPGADFPLTITDDSGTTATFTTAPQRVVSMSPGLTEITFALGAGGRLVAVDTYSDFPPEAKDIQPRLTTYPSRGARRRARAIAG
jgi:ABC-type Fe3+-hydroxamate transport system substrate-binding protein